MHLLWHDDTMRLNRSDTASSSIAASANRAWSGCPDGAAERDPPNNEAILMSGVWEVRAESGMRGSATEPPSRGAQADGDSSHVVLIRASEDSNTAAHGL